MAAKQPDDLPDTASLIGRNIPIQIMDEQPQQIPFILNGIKLQDRQIQ